MKNPDEAIEQHQLAKKDRERLERMRHIGMHMPGLLTCDDGTRWHPTEILVLVDEMKSLQAELIATKAALFQMQEAAKDLTKKVEFQKAAWAADLAENDALQAGNAELVAALELALRSHSLMLLSDPPQEAWKAYEVERKSREALAKWRKGHE